MLRKFSQTQLEAYLDEALPPGEMAAVEDALRADKELGRDLASINQRRDAGVHSLGEIWRRHRVSCPSRDQLGSFLLGALADDELGFVKFHLETFGCRYCQANLEDLQAQVAGKAEETQGRRRKYFQSSAGYLKAK
jgi:hypothetical protein